MSYRTFNKLPKVPRQPEDPSFAFVNRHPMGAHHSVLPVHDRYRMSPFSILMGIFALGIVIPISKVTIVPVATL